VTTYWGQHFPDLDSEDYLYWDTHFPDGANSTDFPGYGPPGAGTFILQLDASASVKHQWKTDIIKRFGGKEQRIAVLDAPKQFYSGAAKLINDVPRAVRSQLARYAALGREFLIGLPYEELTLIADSVTTTVYVNNTALQMSDWAKIGQRVAVVAAGVDTGITAIIQGTSTGTITLDVEPGAVGIAGGRIMPLIATHLEPQQGFARFPVGAEEWRVEARAATFDFAPTLASIALGPLTSSVGLDGAIVRSRLYGLQGNQIAFAMDSNAAHPAAGELVEVVFGTPLTLFRFKPGVTTVENLRDALLLSTYCRLDGTYDISAVMQAGDEMGDFLTGGSTQGTQGTGASLTTFEGRPVWDRPLQVDGSASESIHSMVEIVDMGGIPYSLGTADFADWGREIYFERNLGEPWQWFKLFCATTRGPQKAFWLPTYRDDLTYVSHTGGLAEVIIDAEDGDFWAWYPDQRNALEIKQEDGTITYTLIDSVTDPLDGTLVLSILAGPLSASPVTRISWLELCRFESDDFNITFNGPMFSVRTMARVIRQ
jgi:hypothetical protein